MFRPMPYRTMGMRKKMKKLFPIDPSTSLVLRNIEFPSTFNPSQGLPLMSFASYWIKKQTGLQVSPWSHIRNSIYLGRNPTKMSTILIEFTNSDIASTVLEMYLQQDIHIGEEILEKYMTTEKAKHRNRTLRSCMKTLRLFGHKAKLHDKDELALVVDDNMIYRYQEDGNLVKIDEKEFDQPDDELHISMNTYPMNE